jgi:hypothetical protein
MGAIFAAGIIIVSIFVIVYAVIVGCSCVFGKEQEF